MGLNMVTHPNVNRPNAKLCEQSIVHNMAHARDDDRPDLLRLNIIAIILLYFMNRKKSVIMVSSQMCFVEVEARDAHLD
jgi:hypothetical protein